MKIVMAVATLLLSVSAFASIFDNHSGPKPLKLSCVNGQTYDVSYSLIYPLGFIDSTAGTLYLTNVYENEVMAHPMIGSGLNRHPNPDLGLICKITTWKTAN